MLVIQSCLSLCYPTDCNLSGSSVHGILQVRLLGCPGGSEVKASACNAGDLGLIPGSGRSPGEGNGNPLQYSCHGWRSLVGYSSWGHKESDTAEWLHFHFHFQELQADSLPSESSGKPKLKEKGTTIEGSQRSKKGDSILSEFIHVLYVFLFSKASLGFSIHIWKNSNSIDIYSVIAWWRSIF